jgi:hypothetical protein
MTLAPRAESARASASPIPDDAPVIHQHCRSNMYRPLDVA